MLILDIPFFIGTTVPVVAAYVYQGAVGYGLAQRYSN
jgi:hypothetical protein